jgi:hypothetical protein
MASHSIAATANGVPDKSVTKALLLHWPRPRAHASRPCSVGLQVLRRNCAFGRLRVARLLTEIRQLPEDRHERRLIVEGRLIVEE